MDFSETIAACYLKVGKCRQLVEFMKVKVISRPIGPRSFTHENYNLPLFRNHWAIFNQILYVSFQVQGNENVLT